MRRGWAKDMERDKVHVRGRARPATWEKGSPGCSVLCLVTLLLPFINPLLVITGSEIACVRMVVKCEIL